MGRRFLLQAWDLGCPQVPPVAVLMLHSRELRTWGLKEFSPWMMSVPSESTFRGCSVIGMNSKKWRPWTFPGKDGLIMFPVAEKKNGVLAGQHWFRAQKSRSKAALKVVELTGFEPATLRPEWREFNFWLLIINSYTSYTPFIPFIFYLPSKDIFVLRQFTAA